MTNHMENATAAAQALSNGSDRTAMFFFIIALCLVGGWMIRYFIQRTEALTKDHQNASREFSDKLERLVENHSEIATKTATALSENTTVLRKTNDILDRMERFK